ncbi:alpha/beta hydrolase [Lutibacter sp. HS1-25]|nr:alpha/beta hydrolase [Lutibacter sp. HS1-25]
MFSQINYPIDTSYTVNSTYNKLIKKYPQIKIITSQTYQNVSEKRAIVYKEIGERKLHIDAFLNTSKTDSPAVILIHGGGWKSGNKSLMEPLAQKIASKGYTCFTVEYRLSPEAIYPVGIYDVKNAIQFIKSNAIKFNIDPTKVAILGCSSGGQMAALIGTTNNNLAFENADSNYTESSAVRAIVDIDGVIAFKHPDSFEGEVAGKWLGGNSQEKLTTWLQASALTHTNKNTPPILFIGSQYPRFLAGNNDMVKILDQYGIYHQKKIIENTPHSFWLFHPWFEETSTYIIHFLDKIFKNH